MDHKIEPAISTLIDELARYLRAIEINLDVLGLVCTGILAGDETELQADEESLARSLDEAVYQCNLAAIEIVNALQSCLTALTPATAQRVLGLNREYDALRSRWSELMEAVHHVWKGRQPPH